MQRAASPTAIDRSQPLHMVLRGVSVQDVSHQQPEVFPLSHSSTVPLTLADKR